MNWFTEKEERFKLVAVFAIALCVIGGLLFSIVGKLSKQVSVVGLPQGHLNSLFGEESQDGPIKVVLDAQYMQCPTLPYLVQVPRGMEEKDGMLIGEKDGIRYIVCEDNRDFVELMEDALPRVLNQPVLGYRPKYTGNAYERGKIRDRLAAYQVGQVETKVSVRTITEYTCAYALYFDEVPLVFYASTKDKEKLADAELMLWYMASSIKDAEEYFDPTKVVVNTKPGETVTEPTTEEQTQWKIEEPLRNDFFLDNGICIFNWTNVTVVPEDFAILYDGKVVAYPEEEYSIPGEYVFLIGKSEPKTFQLVGSVEKPLEDVWVVFQELEDYIEYRESEEDPEFFIPRDPG